MSSEELLDTWFLQLDKKDSPVTHKVVYQVTDSHLEILQKSPAALRLNIIEFPVIEAQDRLFYSSRGTAGCNYGRSS